MDVWMDGWMDGWMDNNEKRHFVIYNQNREIFQCNLSVDIILTGYHTRKHNKGELICVLQTSQEIIILI